MSNLKGGSLHWHGLKKRAFKETSEPVKRMISEGHLVMEDILKALSPYRKFHIVRLGTYELNLNTPKIPLEIRDFELVSS